MDKKNTAAAVAIVAAFGAGAGAQKLRETPVVARLGEVRVAEDGRLAINIRAKVGKATAMAIVNCEADGSNPIINSQPSSDSDLKALCTLEAGNVKAAQKIVDSLADSMVK